MRVLIEGTVDRSVVNPQGGADLLGPMWKRVLTHLAPNCKRPRTT